MIERLNASSQQSQFGLVPMNTGIRNYAHDPYLRHGYYVPANIVSEVNESLETT